MIILCSSFAKPADGKQQTVNDRLLNKTAIQLQSHSFTYPLVILDVDISSLLNDVFHCFNVTSERYHMQRSPLMQRKKLMERRKHSLPQVYR